MVIKNPTLGIIVKQPLEGRKRPGHRADHHGRRRPAAAALLATSGCTSARAPAARWPRPPVCGTYNATAVLTPWAGGAADHHHLGLPDHHRPRRRRPAPAGGTPPFNPGLEAGTLNNAAGRYSPFYLRLSRNDGEQEITHFSIKLPPGVTGKLAGIPFCSDAAIAAAKARTGPHGGQEEIDTPSCPAASEVGHTLVGAGVGPSLAYAPGKVYLAGPYNGSQLSHRRDHRRQGRPLRPRHRGRPLGPEDQPRNRRSLRRRHRLGPDPPHHQRHPGACCGTSAPTSTGPTSSSTRPAANATSTASTRPGLGPRLRLRRRRPADHGHQPLPGGRLRPPAASSPKLSPQPQGRDQARRHPEASRPS